MYIFDYHIIDWKNSLRTMKIIIVSDVTIRISIKLYELVHCGDFGIIYLVREVHRARSLDSLLPLSSD